MKVITIRYSNSQKGYTYLLRKDSVSFRETDMLKVPRGTKDSMIYYTSAFIIKVQEIMELNPKVTSWLKIEPKGVITTGTISDTWRVEIEKELARQRSNDSDRYKNSLIQKINTITFKIIELRRVWEQTAFISENTDKLDNICMKIAFLEDERDAICKKLKIVWKD